MGFPPAHRLRANRQQAAPQGLIPVSYPRILATWNNCDQLTVPRHGSWCRRWMCCLRCWDRWPDILVVSKSSPVPASRLMLYKASGREDIRNHLPVPGLCHKLRLPYRIQFVEIQAVSPTRPVIAAVLLQVQRLSYSGHREESTPHEPRLFARI